MEKFLPTIPSLFNTDWGTAVSSRVGKHPVSASDDQSLDEPFARRHTDITTQQPPSFWSIHSVNRPIVQLVRKPTSRHPVTHTTLDTTTPSHVPHLSNAHPHSTTVHIRENVMHEFSTRVARSLEICKNRKLFSNDDSWWKHTRACIEATASHS